MPFDQGIDFRNTAIFVTDPTNCASEVGTTANYPRVTPQGNNVGWEDALGANTRNRSAAVDARLAGIAFTANGTPKRYRIDLPSSGWYRITVALGDQTTAQSCAATVFDNTTAVSHILRVGATGAGIAVPAGKFFDACGVLRSSAADWVTNEVSFVAFFSSTICRITIGTTGNSGSTPIAHFRVTDAVQPSPSLNGGVDFRTTGDFVTDPTNTSPSLALSSTGAADYPHITAQGLTVGWEQATAGNRNRSAAVDARLAGTAAVNDGSQANFRIDLPGAGAYRLQLAVGDAANAQTSTVELFDDSSSLGTLVSAGATTSGQFYDATGTLRTSAANWVSAQQQITENFATTILRLKCGAASAGAGHTTALAHVSITQLAGLTGTSSLTALINRFRSIAATIAGVGTLTASVIRATARTVTIAGTSSLSATITGLHRQITATISGASSLAATISGGKIGHATIAGTSSLSATVSTGGLKPFTATIHGTSSLRAAFPYQTSSATILLKGDDATSTTYLALGSAQIFLNADAPTLPSGYQPSSGVILLAAGSATQPSLVQPSAGVIVVRADAPNLFASYKPVSGVIALRGDPPNVIPYSTPSAVIRVTADPPLEQPIAGVPGRIILTGGPHSVIPIQVTASGVILLKADPADFAHVGIILNQSGIIRLRSDVPVVTPLTEPPPPPPPPPPGTGLAVSGTE